MSACRSCGAPIRWVTTGAGNLMPLNAEPDPAGNIEVLEGDWAVVHPAGQTTLDPGERWMPHWAVCPQAKEWRR